MQTLLYCCCLVAKICSFGHEPGSNYSMRCSQLEIHPIKQHSAAAAAAAVTPTYPSYATAYSWDLLLVQRGCCAAVCCVCSFVMCVGLVNVVRRKIKSASARLKRVLIIHSSSSSSSSAAKTTSSSSRNSCTAAAAIASSSSGPPSVLVHRRKAGPSCCSALVLYCCCTVICCRGDC